MAGHVLGVHQTHDAVDAEVVLDRHVAVEGLDDGGRVGEAGTKDDDDDDEEVERYRI